MTYFSGEPVLRPFDGVTLVNPARQGPAGMAAPTTEAMRQPAAATIQRCYRWMEAAVPVLPQVAALAPVLVTAVQQYAAQQYLPCLQQVATVAQAVRQLRTAVPTLPAL